VVQHRGTSEPACANAGSAGEAPGISRDCFVDCSRVTTFPAHELEDAVHYGRAGRALLLRVAEEVQARAVTLTNAQRKAIYASLK
jgi:hypothetical protein